MRQFDPQIAPLFSALVSAAGRESVIGLLNLSRALHEPRAPEMETANA